MRASTSRVMRSWNTGGVLSYFSTLCLAFLGLLATQGGRRPRQVAFTGAKTGRDTHRIDVGPEGAAFCVDEGWHCLGNVRLL